MKKNKIWKALGIVCSVGIVFVSGMAIGGNDGNWIETFLTVAVGIVIFSFSQYYSYNNNEESKEEAEEFRKFFTKHLTDEEKRQIGEME